MMSSFTPGPWSAKDWRICRNVIGDAIGFRFICDTATNKKSRNAENAANAHLIAAAPDLLAACQAVIEDCEMDPGNKFVGQDAHRKLLAAIAKATT
jgi:hypothetical protein